MLLYVTPGPRHSGEQLLAARVAPAAATVRHANAREQRRLPPSLPAACSASTRLPICRSPCALSSSRWELD